jgi:predicted nucleotidyltransferase component of viral defense system
MLKKDSFTNCLFHHSKKNLVLKGALLLLPYRLPMSRTTKDIDFLGKSVANDPNVIKDILAKIASIKVEDGVEFAPGSVRVERIAEVNECSGVRAHIAGNIGGATVSMQLDIGFGDVVTNSPVDIDYPTILDYPSPNIKVYSLDSAIAEKFEAIVKLNVNSSRMKDFYDIHFIAGHHTFTKTDLRAAIMKTFDARGTAIEGRKHVFGDALKKDKRMQALWSALHKRSSLREDNSFEEVVILIEDFLEAVFSKGKGKGIWSYADWKWIDDKTHI